MVLSTEEIEQTKQQIMEHIESSFPEEKKEAAKQQIQAMNEFQLEQFLIQNNLVKGDSQQCIFCSIISKSIPSYQITESQNAVAVLELNPISRGHTLIIPKSHVQEVSKETNDFAKSVSLKLKEKLSAKDIQIEVSEMFGHKTINLIPIYDEKTLEGKKQQASKEELEKLQKELTFKIEEPKKEKPRKPKVISDKDNWLPKRIP